jgi:superoxide dismutase, Cu-Zn family
MSHRRRSAKEQSGAAALLHDVDGNRVGVAWFTQRRGSVSVQADVRGLQPGFHGFHIHATGICQEEPTEGDAG